MSYRISQLSPQKSTGANHLRVIVSGPWGEQPESFRNMQFWRSWVEYNGQVEQSGSGSFVNWNAVLGLVITVGIGAAFWSGVGLLVSQVWK